MSLITLFTITIPFLLNALLGVGQEMVKAVETESLLPLRVISLPLGISILPIQRQGVTPPLVEARSAVVIDKDSGHILYQKEAGASLEPASLTKLMTALVVIEQVPLDRVVTVPKEATQVGGSRMHLLAGERIRAEGLLKGTLIASANDAAYALALETAGSIPAFARLMNQKASSLGLIKSYFTNPHGLSNSQHKSSALDIAFLTKEALNHPLISQMLGTKEAVVYDVSGHFSHHLQNTNKLIGRYENIIGGKTGTLSSGESLVSAAKGTNDQVVIAAVLDSPDRFAETSLLLDWALKSYIWIGKL